MNKFLHPYIRTRVLDNPYHLVKNCHKDVYIIDIPFTVIVQKNFYKKEYCLTDNYIKYFKGMEGDLNPFDYYNKINSLIKHSTKNSQTLNIIDYFEIVYKTPTFLYDTNILKTIKITDLYSSKDKYEIKTVISYNDKYDNVNNIWKPVIKNNYSPVIL
jgi:hypothetical protein